MQTLSDRWSSVPSGGALWRPQTIAAPVRRRAGAGSALKLLNTRYASASRITPPKKPTKSASRAKSPAKAKARKPAAKKKAAAKAKGQPRKAKTPAEKPWNALLHNNLNRVFVYTSMMGNPDLVVRLVGWTKTQKSAIARPLTKHHTRIGPQHSQITLHNSEEGKVDKPLTEKTREDTDLTMLIDKEDANTGHLRLISDGHRLYPAQKFSWVVGDY
jgi:hypothetical protein